MINERYGSEKVLAAIFYSSIFIIFVVFYILYAFFHNSIQFFFQNTIDFCYIDDKYDLLLIDNHKCADIFLKKVFKMVIFQDFSLFLLN